jgi:hypothetical protein
MNNLFLLFGGTFPGSLLVNTAFSHYTAETQEKWGWERAKYLSIYELQPLYTVLMSCDTQREIYQCGYTCSKFCNMQVYILRNNYGHNNIHLF